jgi:hypothetical protein
MTEERIEPRADAAGPRIVAVVAALTLLLHLATASVYGLFIDELYFLAAGEHLAWGYVDFPPLTALQAWLTRALFGDSLLSIRLFPALAAAGLVLLTGAIVRELGGGRFAQGLAAVAVALAPAYLAFGSYLSMNAIEPLIWMGCALLLLRMISTGETRLWLGFGALAGLGLLNKQTMLLFGFALVAGLALTAERRLMANRWFLLGGLVAFLICLPNLVWAITHGFPHLELLANIRENRRDIDFTPLQFLWMQVFFMNPLAAPLWIAGLLYFLVGRERRSLRALGWAYLIALGVLLALHAKVYYLGPAYPMLLAAGAVSFERWLAAPGWSRLRPVDASLVTVTGALISPMVVPMLPPETYLRYTSAIGFDQPRLENRRTSAMPQFFADRFGWPEMVETVAKAYHALPPEERAKCAIFGNDYGQSGAIDFYGPRLGLPKSIGGHLTNWYWGPRDYSGEIMLVLGDDRESLLRHFESVEPAGDVGHVHAMAQEHFTVFLCRKPRWPAALAGVWPHLKKFE